MNRAMARVKAVGVAIIEGPVERTTNCGAPSQSIYFSDPDGNFIELMAEIGTNGP